MYIRHKERKFGRGCVQQWREQAPQLLARLEELLTPFEVMLSRGPFLLGRRPVYADYALHGVLGNYTYSAQNRLPEGLTHLGRWYADLPGVRLPYRPD
jgi:glutathione S-transferase